MKLSKLIEPGKWHIEFNKNGERIEYFYEDSAIKLLGYQTREDYINAQISWAQAVHPDDQEKLNKYIANVESKHPEGMDYDAEYRILTKHGYHWIHDFGHVIRNEDGSPIRIDGAAFDIQDIIDKQEMTKKLEESLTFTNFFLNTYVSAYFVDLDTYVCQIYLRTEELKKNYPVIDNYLNGLVEYVNKDVHPDDRAELISIMSPEYLKNKLKKVPYFTHVFRDISRNETKYYRVQIIGGIDNHHAAFGFTDITKEYSEQQSRLLGAIPLSSDILTKANIGLWSFELDEGCEPRMYVDEAMLHLIGLDHQIPPEETYHAWYDNIDKGSYDLVADAVAKMTSGEHAEVQYPWHNPNGETWIVRCGGVRNPAYTKGIRIEGTHQNVTELIHFDEKERARAKKLEADLAIEKLRTEALSFIADHEPDLDKALDFFGERILELIKCDQVIFHEISGKRILRNAPNISDLPQEICSKCPITDFNSNAFGENDIVCINDCDDGYRGVKVHQYCPVKSSYMQKIYSGGNLMGLFSVHYINEQHTFSENDLEILKMVAVCLGLMIGRVKEKQDEMARIEAESSSKAKTEFLFNMSHDIRTPMNAILGYTNIAIKHNDDQAKVDDSLKKIKTAGEHLLNLINDILEMSRIEADRLEISEKPLDIRALIESVDQMSSSLAISKSIVFNTKVGNIVNPYVYIDELHTNEILINLTSNAIKYTHAGGNVELRIDQINPIIDGKATFRFEIEDNGIGMSKEFQQHLFEAFSREKTSTVSKEEGAGLGLSIVKKIIDLTGGTISVKSKQNEGSTFTVEMPLRVMDEKAIEKYLDGTKPIEVTEKEFHFEGKKVLLVEDNEMNREIATEILKETGLIIETAEDGAFAVKTVTEKGVDYYNFILMDIQMPVMDGYEATKAIRALPNGDKATIIALSANAFKEDVKKSLSMGMNAHVAKPIDVNVLFETMKNLSNDN